MPQAPLGFALGLLAGLGWAVGTLILKRKHVDVPATVLTGWQLLITAVPITIGALILGDGDWFMPSWQSIVVIGYIALVPMSIGNVSWFAIVGLLPTNVAGLSSIMVPVVAMVSGRDRARRTARAAAMGRDGVLCGSAVAGVDEDGQGRDALEQGSDAARHLVLVIDSIVTTQRLLWPGRPLQCERRRWLVDQRRRRRARIKLETEGEQCGQRDEHA